MPHSVETTADGLLMIANGVDPMLRWDGLTAQMENAGIPPPVQAPVLTFTGTGGLVGDYFAYVRFVDKDENFSNLSPLSVDLLVPPISGAITDASNTTPIVITSVGSNVINGATIQVTGVQGNVAANGTWSVTAIDADHFSLNTSKGAPPPGIVPIPGYPDYLGDNGNTWQGATLFGNQLAAYNAAVLSNQSLWFASGNGPYTAGGRWAGGAGQINYGNLEVPSNPRVVRRQILRNTAGQAQTFYVDIDTTDLTSTVLSSTTSDQPLATNTAVPLLDANLAPLANRFTVPPSHKGVLAMHLGRMFAAVDVEYRQGSVSVVFGSTTVFGIGTEWPDATFANRFLWVPAAAAPYEIVASSRATQTVTLATPYLGPTDPFADYCIRPAVAERRLVYFSEASLPEAWPAINAIGIQEDGDPITGLMPKGSFIYILEGSHVYRFTFQSDPAKDGFTFLSSNRGCVNNRCWVLVEDIAYMLDRQGVHAFSGGQQSEPLSTLIQDLFETAHLPHRPSLRINWAASSQFHAVHSPQQEVIRWFVSLSGQRLPRHALAYAYRTKRWWIEEYPFAITSSTLGSLEGHPQVFVGGPGGNVYALGVGGLDALDPTAAVRGSATMAMPVSLTDSSASFSAAVVGSPLVLYAGRGAGQIRRIVAQTSTRLTVDRPWNIKPDSTTAYQVGGIPWIFRSGWFRWTDAEESNPRRLEILFEPTTAPATANARLYLDRSQKPLTWAVTRTLTEQKGMSSQKGSADLVCDLTKPIGFVQRRFDGQKEYYVDGPRMVQLELGGVAGPDVVQIHAMTLDGAIHRGPAG